MVGLNSYGCYELNNGDELIFVMVLNFVVARFMVHRRLSIAISKLFNMIFDVLCKRDIKVKYGKFE